MIYYPTLLQLSYVAWSIFLTISFGFSAVEKITDYKGTLHYYSSYFKGTFVVKLLSWLLPFIIITEIIITLLYLIGIYQILINQKIDFVYVASLLGCLLLTFFLIGQRIMKDYEGAARLVIYFLLCGLPLLLF